MTLRSTRWTSWQGKNVISLSPTTYRQKAQGLAEIRILYLSMTRTDWWSDCRKCQKNRLLSGYGSLLQASCKRTCGVQTDKVVTPNDDRPRNRRRSEQRNRQGVRLLDT